MAQMNESNDNFWTNVNLIYGNIELIREASNKIIDYASKLQTFNTEENDQKAYNSESGYGEKLDTGVIKTVLTDIKKEVNNILSYSNVVYQHLEDKKQAKQISYLAHLLMLELNWPDPLLYWKLNEICLACDTFSQAANRLKLNPTKKSIKAAFGIDVGIESAKLKAYLDAYKTNF